MSDARAPIALAAGLAFAFALAADSAMAMSCRPWLRLQPAEKDATVHAMIDDALRSNQIRRYDVNRGAIGRCLRESAGQIALEFDDVCADSRSADMQAINRVFKSYVWSCAG